MGRRWRGSGRTGTEQSAAESAARVDAEHVRHAALPARALSRERGLSRSRQPDALVAPHRLVWQSTNALLQTRQRSSMYAVMKSTLIDGNTHFNCLNFLSYLEMPSIVYNITTRIIALIGIQYVGIIK